MLCVSATLLIVVVTVIVCGGSTLSLLTALGIPLGSADDGDGGPDETTPIEATASTPTSPSSPTNYRYYSTIILNGATHYCSY